MKKKYNKPIIKILGLITSKGIIKYDKGFRPFVQLTDKIQVKWKK